MGHQVNFFVAPADLPDLEAAVRSTGDVCFLADKSSAAQPVELGTIELDTGAPGRATGPPRLKYYIVQRQELPAVSTRFISTQGYWLIDDTRSPVIEFSPGRLSGPKLTRGRAYFASDLRFRPELPSPDFARWGDRVLTRIKKQLTRHPEFAPPWLYFGASALQWIHDSGATMTGDAISFTISGNGRPATELCVSGGPREIRAHSQPVAHLSQWDSNCSHVTIFLPCPPHVRSRTEVAGKRSIRNNFETRNQHLFLTALTGPSRLRMHYAAGGPGTREETRCVR